MSAAAFPDGVVRTVTWKGPAPAEAAASAGDR